MTGALTLYAVEEQLQALLDTEDLVSEEQQEEFAQALANTCATARSKRDSYAAFLAYCESQEAFCKAEEQRVKALRDRFEGARERAERCLVNTIKALGTDEKGKYRKLDGNTSQLGLRACPVSVDITNQAAIPAKFSRVVVEMPAELWLEICEWAAPDRQPDVEVKDTKSSKADIKAAIEAEEDVPGARLITDKFKLVRR